MNTLRQAAQQALEALEIEQGAHAYLQLGKADHIEQAIAALRAAIEAAEKQEPMTQWTGCGECDCAFSCHNGESRCIRLQPKQMTLPPWPRVSQLNRGCGVCGIGDNGQIMGYVCTRSDCPTRITCGGVA